MWWACIILYKLPRYQINLTKENDYHVDCYTMVCLLNCVHYSTRYRNNYILHRRFEEKNLFSVFFTSETSWKFKISVYLFTRMQEKTRDFSSSFSTSCRKKLYLFFNPFKKITFYTEKFVKRRRIKLPCQHSSVENCVIPLVLTEKP